MNEEYVISDESILHDIENALRETYFADEADDFLISDQGQTDIRANVFDRYNRALQYTVPWVSKAINLTGKNVIEIGCGTGSSTAAFSHFVRKITGYDIDEMSIRGAKRRMQIMGVQNAELHIASPENWIETLLKNHPDGIDVLLLYAVLEHQTIRERHETIKQCWNMLRPEGIMIVTDTPNLLCYHDYHTSLLPFAHLLPTELYAMYMSHSPREGFKDDFTEYEDISVEELETKICRWGRGISYHDFEICLGLEYEKYIICNGFEQEILEYLDVSQEEELLRMYIQQRQELQIPLAFTRVFLNFILKKSETIASELPSPPENKIYTLRNSNINHDELRQLRQTLAEMQNSARWKLGSFIAWPYRKLKEIGKQIVYKRDE